MTGTRTVAITILAAVAVAGAMSAAFAFRLGASVEFWVLGLVTVTVCIPPLVMQVRGDLVREGIIASCASDTVGVAWLVATIASDVTLMQWLGAYLLLCAYSLALWGLVRLLARFIDPLFASAITMALAIAWLSCPIWLSHARVTGYIPVHPVFALNGAVKNLGIWTERGIAYTTLTNLGQDVPYTLPATIWGAFALHAIVGGVCLAAASTQRRRATGSSPSSPVPSSRLESPP